MRQEKYFLTSSLSLLSFLLCPAEAFDYRFSGRVENFSKIGFNNSQINTKKGIYPTESFIDIVTLAQVKVNLLPKGTENHRLSFSLGGAIAAIPYDKTKNDINQANGKIFGSIVENFIGGYHGYFLISILALLMRGLLNQRAIMQGLMWWIPLFYDTITKMFWV